MKRLLQLFRIPELRRKVLAVIGWLIVFRLLAVIPIPGIDANQLRAFLGSNQLFGFLGIFSGGALKNLSVMMLGVGPYITATIIMQLLTMIFPKMKEMYYEEGATGRAKFNRYSRYLTVPMAFLQGYGFMKILESQGVIGALGFWSIASNVLIITAGSLILMLIGELISEYKLGNGVSLIIFAGIVAGLPSTVQRALASFDMSLLPTYIAFAILSVLIIAGVVFVNQGERKVPISYSKRVRGNRMFGGAMSYLPLRVNQAGVIPIIFAISILLFPQFFAQAVAIFSPDLSKTIFDFVTSILSNQAVYSISYFLLVVIFTYFYSAVTFDPKEIAKNLQRSGGFIPGTRPGDPTADFLSALTHKVTLFGALFLGLIAVLPNITQLITGVQVLTIGGTALLIVVAVALETMKQIDSQLTMREYEGIE